MHATPMNVPASMFDKYNPRRLTVAQAVAEVAAAFAAGQPVTPQHDLARQVRGAIITTDDMEQAFADARAECERLGIAPTCITKDGCDPRPARLRGRA